jgi:ubiquinone/menaquinone biosynthesis C-methylase UbiE
MNVHSSFQAATPFDSIAESYDKTFTESFVGRSQRNLVWREMDQVFRPGQRVLEINCGTGVDAAHLAQRGARVFACDVSSAMIRVARQRAASMGLGERIEFHTMPTEEIQKLSKMPPFDGLLSNFAGLNCVLNLESVVQGLAHLLKPGAYALFCIFGKYCAWEMLWNAGRGDLRKAFRRLRNATESYSIGGQRLHVNYWSIGQLQRAFSRYFRLKRQIGLGIVVPPSYLESLTTRFPAIFRAAAKVDHSISSFPVFRSLADHALLIFERS